MREDILDSYILTSLEQLQAITDNFIDEYNTSHPHKSSNRNSPLGFRYSRHKVIDANELVKAKMNGSI